MSAGVSQIRVRRSSCSAPRHSTRMPSRWGAVCQDECWCVSDQSAQEQLQCAKAQHEDAIQVMGNLSG